MIDKNVVDYFYDKLLAEELNNDLSREELIELIRQQKEELHKLFFCLYAACNKVDGAKKLGLQLDL